MHQPTTADEEKRLARKIEWTMWMTWLIAVPAIVFHAFEDFDRVLTQYAAHSILRIDIVMSVYVVLSIPFILIAFFCYLWVKSNGYIGWPRILAEPLGMTHKIAKLPNGVRSFWHKRFLKPFKYLALYLVILEIAKLLLKYVL